MGDFYIFTIELKKSLIDLAGNSYRKYTSQLLKDGTAFALKLQEDLKKWIEDYSIHEMTKEEFQSLVKSKKDLLEMEALKQEGLAKTDINKLRNGIIEMVAETAIKFLL